MTTQPSLEAVGRHYWILAAIVAAAFVLRVAALGSQGLAFDEGLTLTLSRAPAWDLYVGPVDPNPGLYYLLNKYLIPPDAPLWVIRGISVLAGVGAVPLIYLLGRLSFGKAAGLICAALLAVATSHVDYSQEARVYSLLVLLSLASAVGVMLAATASGAAARRWGLVLFALSNVLLIHGHLTAAPFIAGTSLIVVGLALRRRLPTGEVVAAFTAMAVLAAGQVYRFWVQMQVGHPFGWLEQPTVDVFLRNVSDVILPEGFWENPQLVEWRRPIRLGFILLYAVLAAPAAWIFRRKLMSVPGALIAVYLATPVALWAVGLVAQPVMMMRTSLIMLPGFLLLLAAILSEVRRPAMRTGVMAGLYLVSTLLMGLQHEQYDFREAAVLIHREAKAGDVVLVCPVAAYPSLRYHAAPSGRVTLAQMYEGDLLAIEGPLGTAADWADRHYDYSLRKMHDPTAPVPKAGALAVAGGTSVFVVESICNDDIGLPMKQRLAAAGITPRIEWRFRDWSIESGDVVVTRYEAGRDVTLPVLETAP